MGFTGSLVDILMGRAIKASKSMRELFGAKEAEAAMMPLPGFATNYTPPITGVAPQMQPELITPQVDVQTPTPVTPKPQEFENVGNKGTAEDIKGLGLDLRSKGEIDYSKLSPVEVAKLLPKDDSNVSMQDALNEFSEVSYGLTQKGVSPGTIQKAIEINRFEGDPRQQYAIVGTDEMGYFVQASNDNKWNRIPGKFTSYADAKRAIADKLKELGHDFSQQGKGEIEKKIYHGTSEDFDDFDIEKSADGTIWFTDNKSKIEKGEVAASGKGKIVERLIDESKLKLGGWEENDKYSVGELIRQGYDGLKLEDDDETTYQIFYPEKLGK
jgi:hypothetical protein